MLGYSPKKVDQKQLEFEIERRNTIEKARNGILAFTRYTKPDYQINWHHRMLAQKLNDFESGKIKRLMVFMPPRNGKSEMVSRRLPAYILGRNPDAKIIAASHTADLASAMNRDVQRIIDSTEYQELFPETTLSGANIRTMADGSFLRNSNEFEIVNHTGAYKCAGVGGGLSGRGGHYLILDDPIKDSEEADSPVYRQKLMDWYATVFSTRAEKDAGILITLTRWHEDDLAGRLLKLMKQDEDADEWEVISFPAIKEAVEIEGDPRAEGEALWPEKYPLPALRKIKATGGSRAFNALQQQRPSSEKGDILKREWMMNRYKVLPTLSRGRWDVLLVSADLRFKKAEDSGDYVVYQAWARQGARAYFLGERRGRWGFTDSIKEFKKIIECTPVGKFKLTGFNPKLVENKANGPALEDVLCRHIPGIILVEPDGGKLARVNAITPLWEAGNVWLPDDSLYPEIDDIIEEWVSFGPGCAFDDRTDTMSQGLIRLGIDLGNYLEDITRM